MGGSNALGGKTNGKVRSSQEILGRVTSLLTADSRLAEAIEEAQTGKKAKEVADLEKEVVALEKEWKKQVAIEKRIDREIATEWRIIGEKLRERIERMSQFISRMEEWEEITRLENNLALLDTVFDELIEALEDE
jgi:ribosomal 50S subunit-associated protein YjgA (DUF615 family)